MEVLLMPVPCGCVAGGEHPIELGFEYKPAHRLPPRTWALVRRLKTPCDAEEADALDRLGGVSCAAALADIRAMLAGKSKVDPVLGPPGALRPAAMYAQSQRADRARGSALNPWDPHPVWSPVQQRMMRTEWLLTPRVYRLWAAAGAPAVSDIRMNLRLTRPQIQVSYTEPRGQVVFEFEPQAKRRRAPGWRVREGVRIEGVNGGNTETLLDRILPPGIVRAAMKVAQQ